MNNQEIPDFLTNFYCPTLPRDTKVLRALLEMGAQVEIWPDNSTSMIEDQPLNGDDAEPEVDGEISTCDIRASQVNLTFNCCMFQIVVCMCK